MQPKRYPIGFWNWRTIPYEGIEEMVKEWVDLKFTLAMTPSIPCTPEAHARAKGMLDMCESYGLQVILCDDRVTLPGSNWVNMEAKVELPSDYRERAAAAVKEFGDHPAVWGFFVIDEPVQGNYAAVAEACRIIRELTDKEPYINLLPDHRLSEGNTKWRIENMVGFTDYGAYLDHIVESSQARMLCYDCYSQMSEEWGGRDNYFRNLAAYQRAAIRHDIPFWNITLTFGHWMYRAPSPEELGWQFSTSLAYGSQGIMYFLYREPENFGGYGAPIDSLGQQGPLYHQMRRQHHWFQTLWEDRFHCCKVQRTTHWPVGPSGTQSFDGSGIIKAIRESPSVTVRESPPAAALIGEFLDDQGRPHVMIANNSPDIRKNICLEISAECKAVYTVNGGDDDLVNSSHAGSITQWSTYIMPGQAAFYRVED